MGRKSSSSRATSPAPAAPEIPGCFNVWNSPAAAEADEIPIVARKSLSERKFSEGFEAPRNSLDISSAMFENAARHTSFVSPDEIPFGFEFALRKSSSERVPARVSNAGMEVSGANRCRSPSVIARLMGLETLPPEDKQRQDEKKSISSFSASSRREFLTSRSSREQQRGEEQARYLARQLSGSRLREWSQSYDEEFLLFDVLPFRDHPQEKQLERLKVEFQAQRRQQQQQLEETHRRPQPQQLKPSNTGVAKPGPEKQRKPESSKEMLEAIQFLQSNKEFLVKFLQEPNSVFSKHIYDLQALAAKEKEKSGEQRSRVKFSRELVPRDPEQSVNNLGFSRKLVDSKKVIKKEEAPQQRKREISTSQEKIILLKSSSTSSKKLSERIPANPAPEVESLRRTRSFRDVDASLDSKELARQIARQVRANINNQEELSTGSSEPSSKRYHKDFRVSTSLPSSPRASKSNVSGKECHGQKQIVKTSSDDSPKVENRQLFIQIELTKQKEEQQKKKGGKLLKLFSRESSSSSEHAQKNSSSAENSPRLLVRSKSVPSLVEEKKSETPEALERTNSCKQSSSRSSSPSEGHRGKFSSLKSSLLGKKKSHSRSKSRSECGEIEHSVIGSDDDHYIRTFRETEAQLATTYKSCESSKFAFDSQSPRFLSVSINDGLEHLETSSDIHNEKSEQPSPVSVLERGFIEESPSPVSFEDVSSDLQELQMRLERLKLDESGRTLKPEDSSRHEVDILSPVYVPVNPDSLYVSKLIHTSGFANSIESLFNWHSPSCPIDPYLFGKLEAEYPDSEANSWSSAQNTPVKRLGSMRGQRKVKIGRSFNRVERRPETLHRQMVFDVVNEVLSKRFQYLWNDQPWHEIGKQGINAVPASGKHLVGEVEREMGVFRHEYDRGTEYPLENLVERDVKLGGQWVETREELRRITSQLEAAIFNGLVEELAIECQIFVN